MKLIVRGCAECGACVDTCPHALSTKILSCTQCNACVESCSKGAFREVLPGVYSVDRGKCDGCGECFCPYDALDVKGYARKCDLCGGDPKCVKVCVKNLSLECTGSEKALMKGVLGWEMSEGSYQAAKGLMPYEALVLGEVRAAFKELVKEGEVEPGQLLKEYCSEAGISLPEHRKKLLAEALESELKGFSILDPMLADKELEEITVVGTDAVRVFHRKKGWLKADVRFTSPKKVTELINKMGRRIGRRVSLQAPRLNAVLEDGSRLHAVIPPLTKEPSMTIRKFDRKLFSPRELVRNRTISAEAMAFLWMAMQCDLNVLVCGSTGSGKTTTLDCLATLIPLDERIVIVEEVPEVQLPHEHCIRLVVNPSLGVSMSDLVNDTLRMRPDRVIVGEVRSGGEVKALMNSMLAGQGKGLLATFHALTCGEALQRLKMLGATETDLNVLDLVVVQRRWTQYDLQRGKSREVRKVLSISELSGKPRTLFKYDFQRDRLEKKGEPRLLKRMRHAFKASKEELSREWQRRERFLEKPGSLEPGKMHEFARGGGK